MPSIRFNLSALRLVRFLVATCVCVLLVFSHAFPAYSAAPVNPTTSKSSPQKGEAQLRGIEGEAQKLATEDPLSQKGTEQRTNPGLNEVQGTADINKMSRPENSQDATSVQDKVKNALESVTGKARKD